MTANQISFYKAKTEAEHYRRQDAENARHNVSTEAIQSESNLIQDWFNKQQAKHLERSDAINMAHYERMDSETFRHNQATEGLTEQSNRIKYLEYLNDRDVNAAKVGISEREVAVKEGQLALDEQKLPFVLDQYTSETGLNIAKSEESKAKAYESKTKANYNEKAAVEKQTKAFQNLTSGFKDVTNSLSGMSETIRKWIPILGLQ